MTEAQLIEKIAKYETAEEAVLLGQSYSLDGRSWTYADLEQIQKGIMYYEKKLARVNGSRPRIATVNFSNAGSQAQL